MDQPFEGIGNKAQPGQSRQDLTSAIAIKEFMLHVVPWPTNDEPGYINLHWHLPGARFQGRAFRNVDEFCKNANALAQNKQSNLYFCLSRQTIAAKRKTEDALAFKATWLDLDVKEKGYATIEEAIDALFDFIRHYDLPPPSAVVFSGNGLHVYWFSDRPLPHAEWLSYAEGLKAAALQWGLKCDAGVIADAARVLRVPGTRNFKTDPPKPVRLSLLRDKDIDFAADLKVLLDLSPPLGGNGAGDSLNRLKVADAFKHLDPTVSLGEGIEGPEFPPLPFAPIKAECGWLRHVHDTGGSDQTEPLWRDALRVCMFLEKGESLIHELSNQHADYDVEKTEAKFDRACKDKKTNDLGWPLCKTIRDNGATQCLSCPYLAAEGSPLHLGLQVPVTSSDVTRQQLFDPWAQFIVPKFPLDVLPPMVREFVVSQAEVIGVDEASMAMCVLTTFSSALSHSFRLKMMRHGAWYASPRLWVLLYGDASTKKTPAFNAATDPLEHYQKQLQQEYKDKFLAYELNCAFLQKGVEKPEKPELPIRFVVYDTTIEKLGELLARSERGLLVKRDEFTGWIGSMEKYGSSSKAAKADRAFWLKAFDGGTYAVDRIGRGEIFVENLSVSLIGGVQPEKLAELHGLTSDGLLQRFLPVVMGPARLPIDRASDVHAYDKLVRDLIEAEPQELTLSDSALEVMKELHKHLHELACNAGGLARGFQSFVGKLQGMAGNLALILHMATDPQGDAAKPVGRNTMENMRKLVIDFIPAHAFEFYRSAESIINGDRLKRLASWILTSGQSRFVVSDLTSNIADFRGLTLFEVNERVSPLVAAGWIEPGNPRLGPANRSWNVNPKVFAQFETRVKEEDATKAKLAELMNSPRRTKQ